jgi:hypothetical protein
MVAMGVTAVRPAARQTTATGGVLVRGLVHRLAARGEPMPVEHALAIVVSAAARVHAAHLAGGRLVATLETVQIKFGGTVEVEPSPALVVGEPQADLAALGRLLAELIRGATIPPGLAEAFASVIDADEGPGSAAELARALGHAAKAANVPLSRGELGRWARRQVHPPRLAHTLRRDDVPELGVDLGAVKPKPKLAVGSGQFRELSLAEIEDDELAIEMRAEVDPGATGPEPVEVEVEVELDVDLADLDDLIAEAVTPPALALIDLPAPPVPRSYGTALLAAFAVLVILAAAGVLLFYPR